MIQCVDCGYRSDKGLLHHDFCRLILLQWIHIYGEGKNFCEFEKLSSEELYDLAMMENEMFKRGAKLEPDGYFGKCVIEESCQ